MDPKDLGPLNAKAEKPKIPETEAWKKKISKSLTQKTLEP